jgi:hypothetical protein
MNIYEFITPSDPITFKTDCDKVAFACALILGDGKAGCNKLDDNGNSNVSIPTMIMFTSEPDKVIEDFLGMELQDFVEQNKPKIKECFASFCYGKPSDRKKYDSAVESISDPVALEEFKKNHENQRTSMSAWVKQAWSYGKIF